MKLHESEVTFYLYDPKGIWHATNGMQGEAYAYVYGDDGRVHEWMWLSDKPPYQWVETDPNNDCGDYDGVPIINVIIDIMSDREGFVVSLTDPMEGEHPWN